MRRLIALGVVASLATALFAAPTAHATTDGIRGSIAVTGGTLKYIDPATGRVTEILKGASGRPAWNANGARIAVQVGSKVVVMNSDGSGKFTVRRCQSAPTFDPDGGWIACTTTDPLTGQSTVFVVSLNGQTVTKLVENAGSPEWSPEGDWIGYIKDGQVWKIQPDGLNETQVSNVGRREYLSGPMSWSPNGQTLALASHRDGQFNKLILIDVASGTRTIVPNTRSLSAPSWSPDGHKLAAKGVQLVTLNRDGTGITKLPTRKAAPWPAWQPASVTLRPSRVQVTAGQTVTFNMHLAWLGHDQNLYLQRKYPGRGWTNVGQDEANGQGEASIAKRVIYNAWYRVLWKGNIDHERAWSTPVFVTAHLKLTSQVKGEYRHRGRWNLFHVGKDVIFDVRLMPRKKDGRIKFIAQYKDGRFWQHAWVANYRTYDQGRRAGLRWFRLPRGFEGRIRAEWKGDRANAPARTPWSYVRVTA